MEDLNLLHRLLCLLFDWCPQTTTHTIEHEPQENCRKDQNGNQEKPHINQMLLEEIQFL